MAKSISPDGVAYALPTDKDYAAEYDRLRALVEAERGKGREIVVVMGVGFVGAVMAGVVADSVDPKTGRPGKFVIGMQRPSTRSYWKIPYLNEGRAPVKAEDPEVDPMIRRCVRDKQTLTATFTYDALTFADVVVVDVQCDFIKTQLGNLKTGHVAMDALLDCMGIVGEKIPPKALVLIETTVAPGTTEYAVMPVLRQAFRKRGIKAEPVLAHSFERVMPGRHYVASIRDFWRVCAGCTPEARRRVVRFLSEVLNTDEFPLTVLDRPLESETTKIVENSWRANILAFLDEWSLFAERHGVDLAKVVEAIKVRPTHSNIIFPGPGIGGYCLPKDGGLGWWAHRNLLGGKDDLLEMTTGAIDINDTRALHAAELVRDALKAMGRKVRGARVALLGAAYRQDVGDTRYSGSELIVRRLHEWGAKLRVHDPYVPHWWEFEKQDTYHGSRAEFFRNQKPLQRLRMSDDLARTLKGVDAVVLAVPHSPYRRLSAKRLVDLTGRKVAVVDCFTILSDAKIRGLLEAGCEVRGLGRGHIGRIKEAVEADADAGKAAKPRKRAKAKRKKAAAKKGAKAKAKKRKAAKTRATKKKRTTRRKKAKRAGG